MPSFWSWRGSSDGRSGEGAEPAASLEIYRTLFASAALSGISWRWPDGSADSGSGLALGPAPRSGVAGILLPRGGSVGAFLGTAGSADHDLVRGRCLGLFHRAFAG